MHLLVPAGAEAADQYLCFHVMGSGHHVKKNDRLHCPFILAFDFIIPRFFVFVNEKNPLFSGPAAGDSTYRLNSRSVTRVYSKAFASCNTII